MNSQQIMPELLRDFPEFRARWDEHLKWWNGEEAGLYNDMSAFVQFVIEDLYEKEKLDRVTFAFEKMEEFLKEGDEEAQTLIDYGFFETLQCVASWRPYGKDAFLPFLGPLSRAVWEELNEIWGGKSSLAEVVRAERRQAAQSNAPANKKSTS